MWLGGDMRKILRRFCKGWATIWKITGKDGYGKPIFSEPIHIRCDYGSSFKDGRKTIGTEIIIKNVIWTEYSEATQEDYIAIGKHEDRDPFLHGASRIKSIDRDRDINGGLDDYTLTTAV